MAPISGSHPKPNSEQPLRPTQRQACDARAVRQIPARRSRTKNSEHQTPSVFLEPVSACHNATQEMHQEKKKRTLMTW